MHMVITMDNTDEAMAAAHVISIMARAAAIVAPHSSSVQNNTNIVKGMCDERCKSIGRKAARRARRALGIMLSRCVAPLDIR